jgi:aminoglycoside phosphotransferase
MTDPLFKYSKEIEVNELESGIFNHKSDLVNLLEQQHLEIIEIKSLARLDAPNHPAASFRIKLRNGNLLKARLTWNATRAERVHYFLNIVQDLGFPLVYARYGSALLLEWVSGKVLNELENERNIKAIAEFQGRLHSFKALPDCPFPQSTDLTTFALKIDKGIAKLSEAGLLSQREVNKITYLTQKYRPLQAEIGIIHTDICPQNVVLDETGRLRSIDNESLQIGWQDLDLARTWYRYPLDSETGCYFLECYRHFRNPDSFIRHSHFWFLGVVLDSVVYRLGSPTNLWEIPLIRLKNYLDYPKLI